MKNIAIITAMDQNGIIGRGKLFPWNPKSVPEDMEQFKRRTREKILVVGRKTADSLPQTVFERLKIIALSRTLAIPDPQNHFVADDPNKALELAERLEPNADEIMIGGGAQIYKLFLDLGIVDRMYITFIQKAFIKKAGDIRFPLTIEEIKRDWITRELEEFQQDKNNNWNLIFTTFERR